MSLGRIIFIMVAGRVGGWDKKDADEVSFFCLPIIVYEKTFV
jgi:hypothetical protein